MSTYKAPLADIRFALFDVLDSERTFSNLGFADANRELIDAVLEALSKGITAKFLHGPQQALHQAQGDERARLAALLPQLFRTKR